MSPTFLQGGNAAVPYPSPAMRQPEASTPSMLRLPQRPSDIYTGGSRRSPPDGLTLSSDRRRARDSIPDGTSTATTNGFVSSRPTASDMPPTTPTRSNDASSSEEGEVSEDEPMDVDTRTAAPSATARGSQPEANVVPGDDFSIDEKEAWYKGRSPNEPARPGVLDNSITVENYVEAQLLVLDILGWGIPSEELFRGFGFGISTTLLKTIFNDLKLRLPKDLDSQELPSSSASQGEEPVLSSTLPSSLETPPSSVDHDGSGPIPTPSQSAQRASPSLPDAEPLRNPTLHQNGTSGGEATVSSSSGEELLKLKRSELLAQLQKRRAQTLQAKSAIPSASETPATASRSSPSPAALPTVDQERSDRTNSTASESLDVSPRPSLSPSPMQEDVQPAGTPKTDAETLSLPPPLPPAISMDVSEPSTPSLDPPSDPNGMENEVVVTMPDEGQEPPVRKRSKLDLILREKLAKVKAKEAVASRSKSPSVPPSQPPQIPGPAGISESSPESLPLPRRERSATETTLDAGAPPPRTAVQPPRSTTSSFFSYDIPSTSTPVALDYGLPSPSPGVALMKPPARSYSYDSRSGSRTGKRLRATDFIDENEVPVFLPMLDPYAKVVIDISEDEDEVDEHLREESPVLTPSEDGEPDTGPRETTPVEPGEPASADAFLGSLMVELVEPSPKIDPNDEIKRLKAKIAAMEAMHKKRIMQQDGFSRQTSVDPNAQEISISEAESALSNTPDMLVEDGPATGVIPIDVGEEADGEDESDDIEEDQDQDEEAEASGDPPTMYTGDEDGDQGMLDADNSIGKSQYSPL